MHIIDFATAPGEVIAQFGSVHATSVHLGSGVGESHVYVIRFAPGGQIGEHPTGFGQLFLVIDGSGWVSGPDGQRKQISSGQGAYFACGELHVKGSDIGMTAIMIQVYDLEP